eukprot:gene1478-1609_t
MGKSKSAYQSDEDEDEKVNRKSAKKVAKVAKMLGYTNEINPFGDANLLTPFVWGKKKEEKGEERKSKKSKKEKSKKSKKHRRHSDSGSDDDDSDNSSEEENEATREANKRVELLTEIEKVRKRRQDRENELAELERLRDEEQRLREMAAFGDWQRKEEDFHLEQLKERSRLRLCEFREHPIDRIVKNVLLIEMGEKVLEAKNKKEPVENKELDFIVYQFAELQTPSGIIDSLQHIQEIDQLMEDVENFRQLDEQKGKQYPFFWQALFTVAKSRKQHLQNPDRMTGALHDSIIEDVRGLLKGKSLAELDKLQGEIQAKLVPGQVLDVEYWELLLDEVILQRARADLLLFHNEKLSQWKGLLHTLQSRGIVSTENVSRKRDREESSRAHGSKRPLTVDDIVVQKYLEDANVELEEDESTEIVAGAEEVVLPALSADHLKLGDKYLPRKPRYFNRVRTGWDRTKYNLTHYDHDNPPPKVIQGYKFTIFYPDLLDKTIAPRYVLEPCADAENNEFVIIRFTAGPPYEDIAFKILNKEWDKHRRAGFLCVFDRGVLQLHFNFKRVFYRR